MPVRIAVCRRRSPGCTAPRAATTASCSGRCTLRSCRWRCPCRSTGRSRRHGRPRSRSAYKCCSCDRWGSRGGQLGSAVKTGGVRLRLNNTTRVTRARTGHRSPLTSHSAIVLYPTRGPHNNIEFSHSDCSFSLRGTQSMDFRICFTCNVETHHCNCEVHSSCSVFQLRVNYQIGVFVSS